MRATAQTTVEVALVFPLLILVVIAIAQFAIWFHARNVVVAAVQEGAHVAASLSGTPEAGRNRAVALLRAGLSSNVREDITLDDPVTVGNDDRVRMAARGSLRTFIPWFFAPRGRLELPLDAAAEVSKERFRGPP
jgi:hypothetical protein